MKTSQISANRVMSGTWGEVWLDNEFVAEVYKCQAKITYSKEDVKLCGQMAVDKKITGAQGAGTLGMYHVNSRMIEKAAGAMDGQDMRFTVITKLDDPDSYGAERVSLKNVSFDDLTLADWEAGVAGKLECPFTFTSYDLIDTVEV